MLLLPPEDPAVSPLLAAGLLLAAMPHLQRLELPCPTATAIVGALGVSPARAADRGLAHPPRDPRLRLRASRRRQRHRGATSVQRRVPALHPGSARDTSRCIARHIRRCGRHPTPDAAGLAPGRDDHDLADV